jgi:hypothetical protein
MDGIPLAVLSREPVTMRSPCICTRRTAPLCAFHDVTTGGAWTWASPPSGPALDRAIRTSSSDNPWSPRLWTNRWESKSTLRHLTTRSPLMQLTVAAVRMSLSSNREYACKRCPKLISSPALSCVPDANAGVEGTGKRHTAVRRELHAHHIRSACCMAIRM